MQLLSDQQMSAKRVIKLPGISENRKPTWSLLGIGLALKRDACICNCVKMHPGWHTDGHTSKAVLNSLHRKMPHKTSQGESNPP